MSLYKNKYRIESVRLPNWDYSSNGAYFITICTYEKNHFFGEIKNGEMVLNAVGQFAFDYWMSIPEHFPFILLDGFTVMPNHLHGILIIDKPTGITDIDSEITLKPDTLQSEPETLRCNVSTDTDAKKLFMSKISPKAGSISSIIRSYKNVVKKSALTINPDFEWQERFHDHIIRSHDSFLLIHDYIKNNIKNWKDDRFY